jgi:hypothetical protein
VALIGGALALLAAGAGAAYAYGRPRRVQLTVEDELRTVHTRAGATQPIYDKAGTAGGQPEDNAVRPPADRPARRRPGQAGPMKYL